MHIYNKQAETDYSVNVMNENEARCGTQNCISKSRVPETLWFSFSFPSRCFSRVLNPQGRERNLLFIDVTKVQWN